MVLAGLCSLSISSLGIVALKLNGVTLLLIGDIVLSGDRVILCVSGLTGDDGESNVIDLALVSAMRRLACSRSLV